MWCVVLSRERSCQKNFQMIIITHDLGFVEMLGRSEFVDDCYCVKKELGYYSTTIKLDYLAFGVFLGACFSSRV